MNRAPKTPTFDDAMRNFRRQVFYELYVHLPGSIASFDRASGTATVNVGLRRVLPDYTVPAGQRTVPYPQLSGVPIFALQGGGVSVGADPQAGDPCLICVLDRNVEGWMQQGAALPPPSDRAHHLADCFAFVGFNPLGKPLASARLAGEVGIAEALDGTGAKVVVKNGKASIANNAQNLLTILTSVLTPLSVDPGVSSATKAAALAALTSLAALLY